MTVSKLIGELANVDGSLEVKFFHFVMDEEGEEYNAYEDITSMRVGTPDTWPEPSKLAVLLS